MEGGSALVSHWKISSINSRINEILNHGDMISYETHERMSGIRDDIERGKNITEKQCNAVKYVHDFLQRRLQKIRKQKEGEYYL